MVALVVVAVGAYLLGRARAPEILRSPTASTGVLWACGGHLSGAVALDPGPVRITTSDGEVIRAVIDDRGLIDVEAPVPERSGAHARVEREALEIQVPVLVCAERPYRESG